jgi:hypothetical protein
LEACCFAIGRFPFQTEFGLSEPVRLYRRAPAMLVAIQLKWGKLAREKTIHNRSLACQGSSIPWANIEALIERFKQSTHNLKKDDTELIEKLLRNFASLVTPQCGL